MLLVAPLYRGGNRPMALLVLEVLALAALVALAWSRPPRDIAVALPATLRWGLAILVAYPLLQLVPLPASIWNALPGHAPYARVLELAGEGAGMRPMSMHASATEYAWLAMLPAVAMLLVVGHLGRRQVRALALVFVAIAVVEGLLAILQAGAGRNSLLHFGNPWTGAGSTGTYVNRNHFAALMAMALPVVVALWAVETLPGRDSRGDLLRGHPRHADARIARRILWSLAVLLVLAGLVFSRSRAGIGCGLAAFGAASLALVWGAASGRTRLALGAVAAVALLLAAYAGLTPIVERFSVDDLSLGFDGRLRLGAAVARASLDFMPLGSGLGTFADVFQRYQGEGLVGFIDHAHNDYAEVLLELGAAGAVAVALLIVAGIARWRVLARGGASRSLGTLQVAAGISLIAMALHGLVDFNFHIPANALFFAFLAGVFFHEPRP